MQISSRKNLIVSKIEVGGGAMLKRIQPAPQGRAQELEKDQIMLPSLLMVKIPYKKWTKTNPIGNRLV